MTTRLPWTKRQVEKVHNVTITGRKRFSSCEGKRSYATLEEAQKAAVRVYRFKGFALENYKCPFCEQFHNGNTKNTTVRDDYGKVIKHVHTKTD